MGIVFYSYILCNGLYKPIGGDIMYQILKTVDRPNMSMLMMLKLFYK